MKGKVLDFSVATNSGLISADDGKRYSFARNEWKSPIPPQANQIVDFEVDENSAKAIYLIKEEEKNTLLAIMSFIFSLIGFFSFGLASIVGIVLGHIATNKIKTNPEQYGGYGFAIVGLILGYMVIIGFVLLWIGIGGVFVSILSQTTIP
ncbi:MAG: DUF4190 domain-containing protein [Arcobacter butzleri]|nr:DUF4190 domain-containing protein [Arcobacteraceae bacterium]MDY0365627.1 DUF4190 domain-containing protein [Arcobacteraceae bacterium]NLO17355.1 DUF4190 domain-containing protein [Aliarcobacter butzleri]